MSGYPEEAVPASPEAYPDAAAILANAGWKPHDTWHVYTRGTLVMGLQPDGQAFHVKNWAMDVHGPDTPDDPVEAAQWLVDRFPANPLATEATLDPPIGVPDEVLLQRIEEWNREQLALQSEGVETLEHESDGETGEAFGDGVIDLDAGAGSRDAPAEPEPDTGSTLLEGGSDYQTPEAEADPIDADFDVADLGAEELTEPEEVALLDAPFPEDFAPDEISRSEEETPQDRFIGLDDLDRVRSLRIGDVATEALRLTTQIEQAVSEQDGEFSTIQAYVVSNLDKHTGAFMLQDDTSRATYGRFLELSSARSKIALIDKRRKEATAFLLAAERADVVSFDVQAAFA